MRAFERSDTIFSKKILIIALENLYIVWYNLFNSQNTDISVRNTD